MHYLGDDITQEIVRANINHWDPVVLIGFCPKDEYETEISEIVNAINVDITNDEFAAVIYHVFSKWFGDDFKKTLSDCSVIARKILYEISKCNEKHSV